MEEKNRLNDEELMDAGAGAISSVFPGEAPLKRSGRDGEFMTPQEYVENGSGTVVPNLK